MSEIVDDVVKSKQILNPRPLVTFALFTYNQERYVREAMEAAFSQDYHPLEIIISDDGSSDNTFKIIQEMAESYSGPHKLVVLQASKNLGTLLHVAHVAKMSSGGLLVLAAGDDISKQNRVSVCVNHWITTGAWGIYSNFDSIDDDGNLLSENESMDQWSCSIDALRQYVKKDKKDVLFVHGATSAYDKKIFDYWQLMNEDYILSEDGALSILINILDGKISKIDESLIFYRKSINSLTNSPNKSQNLAEVMRDESCIERFAFTQANRCRLFLRLNAQYNSPLHEDLLKRDIYRLSTRHNWRRMRYGEKISFIFSNKIEIDDLKWSLPRFISVPAFLIIKTIFRKVFSR